MSTEKKNNTGKKIGLTLAALAAAAAVGAVGFIAINTLTGSQKVSAADRSASEASEETAEAVVAESAMQELSQEEEAETAKAAEEEAAKAREEELAQALADMEAKRQPGPSTGLPYETGNQSEEIKEIMASELKTSSAYLTGMPTVLQNPELPTGCEPAALTIALNSLGFDVDKETIVKDFLPYNNNIAEGYGGDPHTSTGAGIYIPGLTHAAQNYLDTTDSGLHAYNLYGASMEDLYKLIAAGHPVLVWTTMYFMAPMTTGQTFTYGNEVYHWYDNEHCVVLYGYDKNRGTVEVSDPIQGLMTRDMSVFESYYNTIGQYAMVIA